mgnify:CR=1 FL=1|tara:strand:+ start:1883 stop:2647 length:765 start_codon:yes stop_codon:yes gene_type:complete
MSKKVKEKYVIMLKGINIEKVNLKYNINQKEEINSKEINSTTTKLSDLMCQKGTPEPISFLDESKRLHTCMVSMIDFNSKMNINLLRYHCYWCKHPFENRPIGCPITYVSGKAIKKYHSHITKDNYTIKENIINTDMKINDPNINILTDEYYETDGVFCSFNCCKAWILDNKHNRLYDSSDMLLTKMYNDLLNSKLVKINVAPHWRILEHYGGHLNIIQFREGFSNIEYIYQGITRNIPKMVSICQLYEEKIKF